MKKVLILGAGLVAKPIVEYLLDKGFGLMIASPMKERADQMINGNPNGSSIDWSTDDHTTLERLVSEYDITVSLLPYIYHADIARVCLIHGKSLVTTSYVQKEIQELNEAAKNRGIIFLNEIGLDPGIDHMSAMKIIDHIHNKSGKVLGFYSLCGALPAPEAANNPMKYKFSWSPKGVILASRNSAQYLKNGKQVHINPADLFKDRFSYNFPGIGELEVYPNRDSISYIDIYGIPETKTMYRGTFRYRGWCEALDGMKALNMLDDSINDYNGMTYSGFLSESAKTVGPDLKKKIAGKLSLSEESPVISSLMYLGFFENEKLPYVETSPFEITSDRMIEKMSLLPEERDMIILQHVFLAEYADGKREVIKSSMLDFGTPSTNTSIARTVALPAAIAVKMILENKIDVTGVQRPTIPQIYNPLLDELRTLGIEMKEEYGLNESEMID